jgi:hypothetical protein
MKRVGTYLWDHLRGRHHIGWSLVSAIVAYAVIMTIHLVGIQLFSEFEELKLKGGAVVLRSTSKFELFTFIGIHLVGVWGLVGVAWSAVRTVGGQNQAGPVARFLSYSIMLLLAAAFVFVVSNDVRRITALG